LYKSKIKEIKYAFTSKYIYFTKVNGKWLIYFTKVNGKWLIYFTKVNGKWLIYFTKVNGKWLIYFTHLLFQKVKVKCHH
jgi:hypothetical protein